MAAPILSYEGLGLVQGAGWLFQDLDIFIGERDRLGPHRPQRRGQDDLAQAHRWQA
jgi:hypothetical protein